MMLDTPFYYAVTIVTLFVIVCMALAAPALAKRNRDLKLELDARDERLSLEWRGVKENNETGGV